MEATKIVTRTLFLAFVGISIITFLCINELYNGTGLTHPIWDRSFNWAMLLRDVVFISFVGGLLSTAAGVDKFDNSHFKKPSIKGGYIYGH